MPGGWRRDGDKMQRLLIFQSLWSMERRHTDGFERTLEQNVELIGEAGFDGVSAHYYNRDYVGRLSSLLQPLGMDR
jgi:hypothetical protein